MVLGQCKLITISLILTLDQGFKTTFTQSGTDLQNTGKNPKETDY